MVLSSLLLACSVHHIEEVPEPGGDPASESKRLYWDDAAGELRLGAEGPVAGASEEHIVWREPRDTADPYEALPATESGGLIGARVEAVGSSGLGSRGSALGGGGLAGGAEGLGGLGTKGSEARSSGGLAGLGTSGPDSGAIPATPGGARGYGAGSGLIISGGYGAGSGRIGSGSIGGTPEGGAYGTSRDLPGFRAGSIDDNADFDAYLEFLGSWPARVDGDYAWLDVSGRRFIQVVDVRGEPLPGARVSVVDRGADRLVWTATTYGDGRVPFYPEAGQPGGGAAEGDWLVQAQLGDAWKTVPWDGRGEPAIQLDVSADRGPVRLDVAFVIDTTGSMSDEIDRIKATLLRVTEQLRAGAGRELPRDFELRYGAVLYRDITDDYITRSYDFTSDIQAFDEALQQIAASGGGDTPESLNQGLARAVDGLSWGSGGPRLMFLIADAPPHMDYRDDVPYTESVRAAVHKGVRIHTVAASGLSPTGTLIFRQIAQYTRGQFVYIEYGSAAASAASHGITGQPASNNLDAILYERIRAELEGWGLSRSAVVER